MASWLLMGKITGVHGLAGNLKVWSHADSPDSFEKGREIRLRDEGDTDPGKAYTIAKVSVRKKGLIISLAEVTTRDGSEALVGKEILMDKALLPELEEDTWYWDDLLGLEVVDQDLGLLGKIQRLFPTGADDILVVESGGKKEVLIPMNKHFVQEVDLAAGKVFTTLPQGFILD